MVLANQPVMVVVDKQKKMVVVTDVEIQSDGNMKKKEWEKQMYESCIRG